MKVGSETVAIGNRQGQGERPSDLARRLAALPGEDVTIGEVIGSVGDRAFGAGMLLFAMPVLLPLPAGASHVLGAPLILIAVQLMIGRRSLWFPDFISNRRLPVGRIRPALLNAAALLGRAEPYLQARHPMFLTATANRLTGAACLVLSLILLIPIPFSSLIPAFALTIFSLGLMYRDGIMIAFGWLFSILASAVTQFVTICVISGLSLLLSRTGC